jgi:hypothetical protein
MGGSSYSDAVYSARLTTAKSTGADVFAHTAAVRAGTAASSLHETLDPSRKNKAGKVIRESFDSDVHPNSIPVAIMFDVTGSMANTPRVFVEKLGKLMAALVKRGFIEHPHILFGAIGDAKSDEVPLQVGQFEAGNEMDAALTNIFLEGNGGGQHTESYELGMYFLARHTDLDSVNKRGKKGYAFFLGDELPYKQVSPAEVKKVIGDDIGEPIPTPSILAELRERFEVFWLLPGGTSHFNDPKVVEPLKEMFGQNLIKMADAGTVVETITTTIGLCEGYELDEVGTALKDVGLSAAAVAAASTALATYAGTKSVVKGAKVTGGTLVETAGKRTPRL